MLKRIVLKLAELSAVAAVVICCMWAMTDHKPTMAGDDCSDIIMSADANGDGTLGLVDPLIILRYMFTGGDDPVDVCEAGGTTFDDEMIEKMEAFFELVEIVEVEDPQDTDVSYKTIVFSECNIQLVNGLEATNGYTDNVFSTSPSETDVNGLGNLIVGYNELRDSDDEEDYRNGSHNIVLGNRQNYTSFAGLYAGGHNEGLAPFATLAGYLNHVDEGGRYGTVIAGCKNHATERYSGVFGGRNNHADGGWSVVVGGGGRVAPDESTGDRGDGNTASGEFSVVSGGRTREASQEAEWVAGSLSEDDVND